MRKVLICFAALIGLSGQSTAESPVVVTLPELLKSLATFDGKTVSIPNVRLWGAERNVGQSAGFAFVYDGSGETAVAILSVEKNTADAKLLAHCNGSVPAKREGCTGTLSGLVNGATERGSPRLINIKLLE